MKHQSELPASDSQALIEEAMARAKLRKRRGKPVRQPKPNVGRAARKILRQHNKKSGGGSSLSELQINWRSLIGEDLAAISAPMKLTGTKAARTLTLRVVPAAAALIQHQEEAIRQRISVAAGGNITRLKIEQGQLPGRPLRSKPARKSISAGDEANLQASVERIQSPRLKAAIVALGRAVLAEKK